MKESYRINTRSLGMCNPYVYETSLGEFFGALPHDEWLEARKSYMDDARSAILERLHDWFEEDAEGIDLVNPEWFSPSEYNFSDDHVEFDLVVTERFYNRVVRECDECRSFPKWLVENFSPVSGFIPFTPSDKDEFLERLDGWGGDWTCGLCMSAALRFLLATDMQRFRDDDILWQEEWMYAHDDLFPMEWSGEQDGWHYTVREDWGNDEWVITRTKDDLTEESSVPFWYGCWVSAWSIFEYTNMDALEWEECE